jgi:hypothetical protein
MPTSSAAMKISQLASIICSTNSPLPVPKQRADAHADPVSQQHRDGHLKP